MTDVDPSDYFERAIPFFTGDSPQGLWFSPPESAVFVHDGGPLPSHLVLEVAPTGNSKVCDAAQTEIAAEALASARRAGPSESRTYAVVPARAMTASDARWIASWHIEEQKRVRAAMDAAHQTPPGFKAMALLPAGLRFRTVQDIIFDFRGRPDPSHLVLKVDDEGFCKVAGHGVSSDDAWAKKTLLESRDRASGRSASTFTVAEAIPLNRDDVQRLLPPRDPPEPGFDS